MSEARDNAPIIRGHNPVLDGVRGLAILLVVAHHAFLSSPPGDRALDRVVFGVAFSGWCGVDLFFVLSGFLITGILYDTKGQGRYFRNFYARRTLRIFPLYYATLVLFFVVFPAIPDPTIQEYVADTKSDQVWYWTYLTNFRIAMRGKFYGRMIPDVFWSLAIEEQFYLVWPAIVLLCKRRTMMLVCVLLFLVAMGTRIGLMMAHVDSIVGFTITPTRLDSLVTGAFIALLWRGEKGPEIGARWARFAVLPALALVVWLGVRTGKLYRWDRATATIGYSVIAGFWGSILVLSMVVSPMSLLRRSLDNRAMRTFGKYSYAIYVFHGPVGGFLKRVYRPADLPLVAGSGLPRAGAYALALSLASLVVALITWNLLEKHCLKLKSRFRGATPRAETPPPTIASATASSSPRTPHSG